MSAIMTSDNEVVTFEFYSIPQSAIYVVEFDASFDLDPNNKLGCLLDDFYSLTITQSKKIEFINDISDHMDVSNYDTVGLEIAEILDRFMSEKPFVPIYFNIDKEDNKDGARERLFEKWYNQNSNKEKYSYEIFPLENTQNHQIDKIGVIIPKNGDKSNSILDAFLLAFTFGEGDSPSLA